MKIPFISKNIPSISIELPRWIQSYKRLSFEETFWGWVFTIPAVLGLLFFKDRASFCQPVF